MCIPPFLLIVPVSVRTKRLLQSREIRRIDFSLTNSYPLRVSSEIRKASAQAAESKAERQPCFVKYNLGNSLFQRYSKFLVLIKAFYVSFKPYQFNNETKRSKLVFRACFCYLWEQRYSLSQVKRQSCLKVTLKSIRRTSRAWSTRFYLTLAPTAEVVR